MAAKTSKTSLEYYNTLRKRAFATFSLVLSLLIVLSSFVIIFISRSNTKKDVTAATHKITENVTQYFSQTVRICSYFSQFQTVSSSQLKEDNEYLSQSLLADNLSLFINRFDYIAGIEIQGDDFSVSKGVVPSGHFIPLGTYEPCQIFCCSEGQWPFYLKFQYPKNIHSKYDVSIYIYTHKLSRLLLTEGSYVCSSDRIILSSDETAFGKSIHSVEGYEKNNPIYITYTDTWGKGIQTVTVQNSRDSLLQYGLIVLLILFIGILILSVILLIANFSFQKIYSPIGHVADMIKYYVSDETDTDLEQDITYITDKLENLFANSTEKEQKVVSAMLEIKKSQIQALQSQVSPHFVSNILDNLKWMASEKLGPDNELETHIVNLNRLIHHNIKQSETLVSIQEEMALCSAYLELMQSCFTEKIHIKWDVPEEYRSCPIIKFTFQPLIENAIHHGFSHRQTDLRLSVTVRQEGKALLVAIENNGRQIDSKTLSEIRASLSDPGSQGSHIGIKNIHLRIQLMFGESYGVREIESSPAGTRILLVYPHEDL